MKITVTGGTGFLGSELVPRLVAAGHEVRCLARSRPRATGITWIEADIANRDAVKVALEGAQVVYHLAGRVSRDPKDGPAMYALHVERTRELLEESKRAGIRRFVLASTSGTIAVSRTKRVGTEKDDYPIEVVGRWPYYMSKIFEEKMAIVFCRREGIDLVVMNPSLVLGPGDERLSSTGDIVNFLNRDIPAMPSGGLSFVDVRDAADAFVAALDRGEVFGRHLIGVNMSFTDWFGRLERLTGVPAPMLRLPSKVNVLGAQFLERVARWRGETPALDSQSVEMGECFFYLDASKAERLLGFKARDPQETLHDTVQYILSTMPKGHLPGVKGRLQKVREGRA